MFGWAPGALEIILGVFTIVGSLWTAIEVFKRRAEKNAEEIKADIKKSSDGDRTRLGRVEGDVGRLDSKVKDLDNRMHDGFRSVDERFSKVNEKLATVATKDDVKEIEVGQARMESRMATLVENDRRFLDMLTGQGQGISKIAAALAKRIDE